MLNVMGRQCRAGPCPQEGSLGKGEQDKVRVQRLDRSTHHPGQGAMELFHSLVHRCSLMSSEPGPRQEEHCRMHGQLGSEAWLDTGEPCTVTRLHWFLFVSSFVFETGWLLNPAFTSLLPE